MTEPVYTWGVANLEVAPEDGELTNVVRTIHWTLTAFDDSDNFTASCYGSCGLDPADPEDFTEFENLDSADVEAWLEAKLDAPALRSGLAGNIETQRNPPIVSMSPPWVS